MIWRLFRTLLSQIRRNFPPAFSMQNAPAERRGSTPRLILKTWWRFTKNGLLKLHPRIWSYVAQRIEAARLNRQRRTPTIHWASHRHDGIKDAMVLSQKVLASLPRPASLPVVLRLSLIHLLQSPSAPTNTVAKLCQAAAAAEKGPRLAAHCAAPAEAQPRRLLSPDRRSHPLPISSSSEPT